jgi:hypothetical protein
MSDVGRQTLMNITKEPLNQNKMTAVEWLQQELDSINKTQIEWHEKFEQAKEMEKEHLYNFYMQGGVDAITEADRNVEQYYNEIFNKK